MAENNIIVAFELGSSKIAGVAAQKNPDGSLKIKAYAHKDSGEFIRKGTVSNVDKTVAALKEIKQQLEATLQQHGKSADEAQPHVLSHPEQQLHIRHRPSGGASTDEKRNSHPRIDAVHETAHDDGGALPSHG